MSEVVKGVGEGDDKVITAQQLVALVENEPDIEWMDDLPIVVCLGPGQVVYPVRMYIDENGPDLVLDTREED